MVHEMKWNEWCGGMAKHTQRERERERERERDTQHTKPMHGSTTMNEWRMKQFDNEARFKTVSEFCMVEEYRIDSCGEVACASRNWLYICTSIDCILLVIHKNNNNNNGNNTHTHAVSIHIYTYIYIHILCRKKVTLILLTRPSRSF